jgi:hypothetical protein
MGYVSRGAKVRVSLIKEGSEIRLLANQEGFRYLAELCESLAAEDYDQHKVPHVHVEPALNTAELESVPMELYLTADP